MTAPTIHIWPRHLLRAVTSTFALGSLNGFSQPLFAAARHVFADPFEQRWYVNIESGKLPPVEQVKNGRVIKPSWREVDGRIARFKGSRGFMRFCDPLTKHPQYNAHVAAQLSNWSGGRTWSGGRQWAGGFLPPFMTVDAIAHAEAESIVVRGLPASIARVLRIGDRFEARPNGVPADHGHYYMLTEDSSSNAAGKTRLSLQPGLRAGLNAGDQIVLKYPTSVFSLADDKQGAVDRSINQGEFGFSLIEKLPSDL